MKSRLSFRFLQLGSQFFSSAISALLVLCLINLNYSNANDWSLGYSGYLIIFALVRSLSSEPLIYSLSTAIHKTNAYRVVVFSLLGSATILLIFMFLTGNKFFLVFMVPSAVNAIQDYSRYLLISQSRYHFLIKSDLMWFMSVLFTFLFLKISELRNADLVFISIWSFFGIISLCINFRSASWCNTQQFQEIRLTRSILRKRGLFALKGSLLLDKVVPRIIVEAQFFVLLGFWPAYLADYRIANLLMGFANVYVMSTLITLAKNGKSDPIFIKIGIIPSIMCINLLVVGTSWYFVSSFVSLCAVGLTLALILDMRISRRVTELRKIGEFAISDAMRLRTFSSFLVLLGFVMVVIFSPSHLFVSFAASTGSLFSLALLSRFK